MSKIISIHSFRRGTGRSVLSANLAALLAMAGYRTALIDLDVPAPSTQVLFHLLEDENTRTVNDYLLGLCRIEEAARDETRRLGIPGEGRLYVIPSSLNPAQIAQTMRTPYDVDRLDEAFQRLVDALKLDVLLVDTRAGITDDTLLMLAISYSVALIMRPDQHDYQGTGVTLDLARKLGVPRLALVVNQVPASYSPAMVAAEVSRTYDCEAAAVLPFSERLMTSPNEGIFVMRHPEDPLSTMLWELMARLVGQEAMAIDGI